MSVKFQLKKNAYIKKGAVGFSYTTYFWGFFVPIFRGDGKGFLMLLIAWILLLSPVYLIKYFFRNFIFNPNSLLTKILTPLLDIKLLLSFPRVNINNYYFNMVIYRKFIQ